jgi:hypothetical protein
MCYGQLERLFDTEELREEISRQLYLGHLVQIMVWILIGIMAVKIIVMWSTNGI